MKELKSVTRLSESFHKLPGIGQKSAERLSYAVLEMKDEDAEEFAAAIKDAKQRIRRCRNCGLYSEGELCEICSDKSRDKSRIIVVSYPRDVYAFEKLGTYDGLYHVLGGVLSPLRGIGAEQLSIASLLDRIDRDGVKEVIVATNPTTEGETTALYLGRLLKDRKVSVSRLAYGLPAGGSLEYADALTLSRALEGRKKL